VTADEDIKKRASTYIRRMKRIQHLACMVLIMTYFNHCQRTLMTVPEVLALQTEPPTEQISYGPESLQFGDLRLPEGEGPFPVVAIIHGGCWLAAYDLHLMDAMATDLTQRGYATWNLEYRRVGDEGGGWPGTFEDIADGLDKLRDLAETYPLDLGRLVITGHSAGGHLALWAGSRSCLTAKSPLYRSAPIKPSGIVSLAGIVDLEHYLVRTEGGCGSAVKDLMGGFPEDVAERYRQTSPVEMPLTGIARTLITGKQDPIVPVEHVARYREAHPDQQGMIEDRRVGGIGHFEVIAPDSKAWPDILDAIEQRTNPADVPKDRRTGQRIKD
jgi:acetyl esterase/lipase